MSLTLSIPSDYGYVLLVAAVSGFVNTWHSVRTGGFRTRAKVPYPNCYAPASEAATDKSKYLFNCAQRAHANYTENETSFLTAMLISGLKYPLLSAVLGLSWYVGRVVYAYGYTLPDQEGGRGRYRGVFWNVSHYLLILLAGWTASSMVLEGMK